MNYLLKLMKRIGDGFHVCVGLDSSFEKIPQYIKD